MVSVVNVKLMATFCKIDINRLGFQVKLFPILIYSIANLAKIKCVTKSSK